MTTFVGTATFKPVGQRENITMFFLTAASTERNAVRAARRQMRQEHEIRSNGPIKVKVRESNLTME